MVPFNCISGSSFSDVCMNTYGSMDQYVKLLNDNGLTPDSVPYSGQIVMWDDSLVSNQSIQQVQDNSGIKYATLNNVTA